MDNLKNKIVLIVDDEARNTFALCSYLESLNMIVATAKNGQEAISYLRGPVKPNIILLDMMMPVMDGYETMNVLKQNDTMKDIPVIAVTARAMKGDREKCIEAGAWDYLSKPLDTKLLIEKLNEWIR
jgi:CheY-like chemotaxis protein